MHEKNSNPVLPLLLYIEIYIYIEICNLNPQNLKKNSYNIYFLNYNDNHLIFP